MAAKIRFLQTAPILALIVGYLVGLCWMVWESHGRAVPAGNSIWLGPTLNLSLPWEISRWWDIVACPIWFYLIVYVVLSCFDDEDEQIRRYVHAAWYTESSWKISLAATIVPALVIAVITSIYSSAMIGLGVMALGIIAFFALTFTIHPILRWKFADKKQVAG